MYGHLTQSDYKLIKKLPKIQKSPIRLELGGIIWIDRSKYVKSFIKSMRALIAGNEVAPKLRDFIKKIKKEVLNEFEFVFEEV